MINIKKIKNLIETMETNLMTEIALMINGNEDKKKLKTGTALMINDKKVKIAPNARHNDR